MSLFFGNLGKKLADVLGSAADAIIPGDQSSWHRPTPAPQPAPQPAPSRQVIQNINRATGFNNTPFQAPQIGAPRPVVALQRQPIVVPKINMPFETAKQFGLGMKNTFIDSANNLTNIGLGAGAMGVDALARAAHNKQLSDSIQPYIKGTVGAVPWVQDAAAKKQAGGNITGDILKGAAMDTINAYGVVPVGLGAKIVVKGGKEIAAKGAEALAKTIKSNEIKAILNTESKPLVSMGTKPSVTMKTPSVAQSNRTTKLVVDPNTGKPKLVNTTGGKLAPLYEDYAKSAANEGVTPVTKVQYEAAFKTSADPVITPKNPARVNTANNPFKSPIPKVKSGDYGQIISNEQVAANPTVVAGNRWQTTMKKLQKTNPSEYGNFWKHVEDTKSVKSPALQRAVDAWREVDNRIHGTSQQLGGNTNYLKDHGLHPWNLPEDYANHLSNGGNPQLFPGLNSIAREYRTIAQGEANGLTLGTDPLSEGSRYVNASAGSLRRRAIIKGIGEADGHITDKTHFLDIGGGDTIPLSKEAHSALRGIQTARYSENKIIRGVRTANNALKTTILSGGQFHPVNISVMRAGPSIALAGHPVRAFKGVVGTFTATKGRVAKMYDKALTNTVVDPGTGKNISIVDAAAKIGSQYAQKGYDTAGSALKRGVGHKLVFEQQIPMMHDQVVRSVLSDLVKKGVPLDSNAARQAGIAANSTMGFINKEALNLPVWVRKGMSDWMLASQFTPSKIVTLSKVAKGGVAGKYARADVISNVAAATALIAGVGYVLGQKSDNITDSLLRGLINPSIPTNEKDRNGNNIEMRIPLTYTAEVSKLLGISLKRNPDGHLGVQFHPDKALSADSGLVEWMRSRLAPVQSDVLKVITNTNFSSKPLYDPNASLGTKAIQAATTIATGTLPIGLQGLPYTDVVKNHVPGPVKEILDANTPGTNPLVKSAVSSIGFSPRTDQTVGKGLETSTYFSALDQAKKDLNSHEAAALELFAGSKKNPVTGKYDVQPNVNDARAKATALLENPKVIGSLINMNQSLAKAGQSVDPLWKLPQDQVQSYLQYSSMAPGSADKTDWVSKNPWYYGDPNNKNDGGLAAQRTTFFDSLPAGDPNKPKLDLQYPQATPQTQALQDQYSNLTDSTQKGQFLDAHPEIIKQWNAQTQYTNDYRTALGYSSLKGYPEPTDTLQKFMNQYSGSDKGTKKGIRNANPQMYQSMIAYFDSVDLYNINKQGAVNQLQGQPDQTSKQNKAISGLAKDIYQNADGTYSIVPAGWMNGLNNGGGYSSGYGSSKGSGKGTTYGTENTRKYAISLTAGGTVSAPKVSVKQGSKAKVASKGGSSKPKVSVKRSLV